MAWLINAEQLDKFRKNQRNVVILNTHSHETFAAAHIPGARFLDLNKFADTTTSIPNQLSTDNAQIQSELAKLNITSDVKVILYDHGNYHPSSRALWMLKVFGHNPNQLYILDGGWEAWHTFNGKTEAGEVKNAAAKPYHLQYQSQFICSLSRLKENLQNPIAQVIDLRHAVRYAGGKEANPELRQGHIPGSFSLPFIALFESNQSFKSLDKIKKQLSGIGIDLNYPIITTCGSGKTAAILNFILDLLGHTQHSLYDGSWSEWGTKNLYPGETSLAERPVVTSLE